MFNFFRKKPQIDLNLKPVVLLILDGWGVAPVSEGNAIAKAGTPNIDKYLPFYPHGKLIASGEAVGLPANEVGNTEVGHLTIGAGRVMNQGLKRINVAIAEGVFYDNEAFKNATEHVKLNNSKLHIMGLIGSGQVHSSIQHLFALLQFCKNQDMDDKVYLHLFTDGRDSAPNDAIEILKQINSHTENLKIGSIASVCGRYYAMDRDGRWDRTQKAYKAIVAGQGLFANSAGEAISASYAKSITDEFIEPTVILKDGKPVATVDDRDAVIFFNYRIDRPRQLTMAIVMKDFEHLNKFEFGYVSDVEKNSNILFSNTFKRDKIVNNLFFVTMTQYQENVAVSDIAFAPQVVQDPLSVVVSKAGFKQLHIAESEKERFVTYYFDGLRQYQVPGEDVIIIPSPQVATYDKKPEMSIKAVMSKLRNALEQSMYKFIVVNFANADMVAHSGNLAATIKAVKITEQAVGELIQKVLDVNGTIFITSDHGNAEELLTFPKQSFFFTTSEGRVNTEHSNNPVPYLVIGGDYYKKQAQTLQGALCDVAPTILGIMNIQKSAAMTGKDLLK